MTFEIAHCVFTLLRYEERDKISPICLVVVPLIACLLALGVDPSIKFDLHWQLKVKRALSTITVTNFSLTFRTFLLQYM